MFSNDLRYDQVPWNFISAHDKQVIALILPIAELKTFLKPTLVIWLWYGLVFEALLCVGCLNSSGSNPSLLKLCPKLKLHREQSDPAQLGDVERHPLTPTHCLDAPRAVQNGQGSYGAYGAQTL